jgi:hypothetical protein
LAALLGEAVFQHLPIVTGNLVVGLLGKDLNDIHDREPPGFGGLVIAPSDLVLFEEGWCGLHV